MCVFLFFGLLVCLFLFIQASQTKGKETNGPSSDSDLCITANFDNVFTILVLNVKFTMILKLWKYGHRAPYFKNM